MLDRIGHALSEDGLIRIDHRGVLLLLFAAALFPTCVTLRLHGSSLPIWNSFLPDANSASLGLVAGTPKAIRFDEWAVLTPAILSQAARGFPDANDALGGGKAPLLMDLPVRSFPAVLRPQFWGFFGLDTERGFSFYWNFRALGLVLGVFFLSMLLTRNDFWWSLAGALWLFYSSFVQWWFSQAGTTLILSFSAIAVGAIYLCFSTRPLLIALSAPLIIVFSITFALSFYPPFQIPLVYLLAFLLAGYVWAYPNKERCRTHVGIRAAAVAAALLGTLAVLGMFYAQAADTMALVAHTVYPGSRRSPAGDISLARLFAEFFGLFLFREGIAPQQWDNVCEASNFLLLFPLVLPAVFTNVFRRRKNDPVVVLLLAYLALLTAWMLVPLPAAVGTATLLDRVPCRRALIGAGTANILLIIRFLSGEPEARRNYKEAALAAPIFILLLAYGWSLRRDLGLAMSSAETIAISALFAFVSYCVLSRQRWLFSLAVLPAVMGANYDINPVSTGLSPLLGKEAWALVTATARSAPAARWIAYGSNTAPGAFSSPMDAFTSVIIGNFLAASGTSVFNGTKFAPDLATMRRLDPKGHHLATYNRYAHIQVLPNESAGNVEEAVFRLGQYDVFTIQISPCAPAFDELGIRYFAFSYLPTQEDLSCLSPLSTSRTSGLWFYERHPPAAAAPAAWPSTTARLSDQTASAG